MSRVVADGEAFARSEAAMGFRNQDMCEMPTDWIAAEKAGWRIVHVKVEPICERAAYRDAVLAAFDELGREDREKNRERKAAVEHAGRKRL
jgi:hypothetical protein